MTLTLSPFQNVDSVQIVRAAEARLAVDKARDFFQREKSLDAYYAIDQALDRYAESLREMLPDVDRLDQEDICHTMEHIASRLQKVTS